MYNETPNPEKSLHKLEELSENVRLIDQPRSFGYQEVEKLLKIAYLEGQFDIANHVPSSCKSWGEETANEINEKIAILLKIF
jgi:hypothetical protein